MKKKINKQTLKIKHMLGDYMPVPEDLVISERSVKVTINLSEYSIHYFKKLAKKHNTKYQKLIRALLDKYAHRYSH